MMKFKDLKSVFVKGQTLRPNNSIDIFVQ